jgi:hypothetical protein
VVAFQTGSPDGFGVRNGEPALSGDYVDGVSLTHGNLSQHIWTLAAALPRNAQSLCSCNGSSPLPLVGNDYFCSADGITTPLWQGPDCVMSSLPPTCCSFNDPPWFYKQLPQPTTDDIEMRVSRDEDNEGNGNDKNIQVQAIEIYVQ